jgi:hypothetical protein
MAYGFIPETRNLIRSLAATAFTASPGPADSTRSRLNDKRLDRPYVMNSAVSAVSLVVDLGSAQQVNTAAVLNHNLAAQNSANIAVAYADDAGFTTGVGTAATMTPATTYARPKDSACAFNAVTKRYWRFTFAWAGGASVAISIGELVLGVATTLSRGELDGSGETESVRAPTVELSNGGTRGIFLAGPVLTRSLVFSDFTTAERDILRTMWRDCRGPVVPLLWCENWTQTSTPSESQQQCLYGHLQMPEFGWRWSDWQYTKPPDIIIRSQGREVGA